MIIEMLINGGGQHADERQNLNEIKIVKKKVFPWLPIYQRRIMNEIVVIIINFKVCMNEIVCG